MSLLFDITAEHIGKLNDTDLRTLVGLLCEADFGRAGLSPKSISWGGAQDAADEGIDVEVESSESPPYSFISRNKTGFQVKKADMPPSAIEEEMKPGGALRQSIKNLIENKGAYIIASAKSTTPNALKRRINAMKDAVADEPGADLACVEFYDGSKLASWVRQHASVAIWLRNRTDQPLRGWRAYGIWAGNGNQKDTYIIDDGVRLRFTENSRENTVNVQDGLKKVRSALSTSAVSLRLVGLSGLGKTRFTQALFEEEALCGALPPSLAVYTDISDNPDPDPVQMAEQCIASHLRVVMIVDNCHPNLHRKLTSICASAESQISLLSIEYDVRDDLPDETQVFAIEPSSDTAIQKLIKARYPKISDGNARTIALFAGGNAKVAIALANTVEFGETLSSFRDEELFLRLFKQRHVDDKNLVESAQALSLVYSFDGETTDGEDSELQFLATLASTTILQLYRDVNELQQRSLIQSRGPWRAILPQAIADRLAKKALQAWPPKFLVRQFKSQVSDRLIRSFSRRIGYLHDNAKAVEIANLCFGPDGLIPDRNPSSTQMSVLENIAPVVPLRVIEYFEHASSLQRGSEYTSRNNPHFNLITSLLIKLAYEPIFFDRCAKILVQFALSEHPDENVNSIHHRILTLFQLYLSGTHASVEQRRNIIDDLVNSALDPERELGFSMLDQALSTGPFTGQESAFGARPRDYGFQPNNKGAYQWYDQFIRYSCSLAIAGSQASGKARKLLSSHFRQLWRVGMYDILDDSARSIHQTKQWNEGWLAIKSVLQYDRNDLEEKALRRLIQLEVLLRPGTLEDEVRSLVLPNRWDVVDPTPETSTNHDFEQLYQKAIDKSRELGKLVAKSVDVLNSLLPEILMRENERIYSFGIGLGEGSVNLHATWKTFQNTARQIPYNKLKLAATQGFIRATANKDMALYSEMMDYMVETMPFAQCFPWLQYETIDAIGIKRLWRCLELRMADIGTFRSLGFRKLPGSVNEEEWINLLRHIQNTEGGMPVVIECLYIRSLREDTSTASTDLQLFACEILSLFDFRTEKDGANLDHELAGLIEKYLKGDQTMAEKVCQNLKRALNDYKTRHHYPETTNALARSQPVPFLDTFCGAHVQDVDDLNDIGAFTDRHRSPYALIPDEILLEWCVGVPDNRVPAILRRMPPFHGAKESKALAWRPVVFQLLELPTNLNSSLASLGQSVRLTTSGDSIVAMLEETILLVERLATHNNPEIRRWSETTRTNLQNDINSIQEFERNKPNWGPGSFE